MIEYIALNCPKIKERVGEAPKGCVYHSFVNEKLGKPDCNLTEKYLDECEVELGSHRVGVLKKKSSLSHGKKESGNGKKVPVPNPHVQMELDFAKYLLPLILR